ncbi:MAG TPA: TonB-dependent receptor, partial [Acidobacteriota bacterium]|nr:TonB-dependent receptor [Acidobacteriota bacterium]
EGGQLSASFDETRFQSAPMFGVIRNNPAPVLLTLPGVGIGHGGSNNLNFGGIASGNNIQLGMDGAATDGPVNQIHQMEDVEEVVAVTSNNSAEYSRAAFFNLVTRRGTNDFHGSAFYNHQNSVLNARQYFDPSKPSSKFHTAGISLGGPIIRDKTFFFASYTTLYDPSSNWFLRTVPTANMRAGDFSQLLNLTNPVVIKDPLTGEPFPGNVIPENRIDPISTKVQEAYLPLPNRGGPDALAQNLDWLHPWPNDIISVKYPNLRIDHKLFENNELSGRFLQRFTPYSLPGSYPALGWTRNRYAWHMVVSDTHIFSPSLTHTFRFSSYLNQVEDGKTVDGFTPLKGDEVVSQLGLQGVNRKGLSAMGFPEMSITGLSPITVRFGGRIQDENILGYTSSTTWSSQRHVLKFGGELRTFRDDTAPVPAGTYGSFNFNGSLTGYPYADFLLGLPFSSTRLDPLTDRVRKAYELGLYITDSFKISPRLTVDYGIRWDYFGAPSYEDNLVFNWNPATSEVIVPQEALSAVSPLYPSAIKVVPGEAIANSDKGNFAPRLGLAYRIKDDLVLRGGYGIMTESLGPYNGLFTGGPFQLAETFFNEIQDGQPLFAFPNPFPEGSGTIASQSISGTSPDVKNGYIQQFNVTLEKQVRDTGFRVSYVGTRARGMNYSLNINKPEPSNIPFSPERRPYPEFVNAVIDRRDGAINYDALIVRAIRKVGSVTFDAHWTWAHNMANFLNTQNPYDPIHWNRVDYTPNHRGVVNLMWQLPFGQGQRYLNDVPPVVNYVLGNWQLYWVTFLHSGQFFSPSFSGSDPSNTNSFGGLPDRIADGNLPDDQRSTARWFDSGAFVVPPPGRFGNSGVNILEGPRLHTHNVNFMKNFALTERFNLEFSTAFTNLFNQPNFLNPAANISVPGQVGTISSAVGVFSAEQATARRAEVRLRLRW